MIAVSSESARGRHRVVDTPGDGGENLTTLECFCGATQGEDYERYSYHLAEHSPEDVGLGGDRRAD